MVMLRVRSIAANSETVDVRDSSRNTVATRDENGYLSAIITGFKFGRADCDSGAANLLFQFRTVFCDAASPLGWV
jgi:hypothetical protein